MPPSSMVDASVRSGALVLVVGPSGAGKDSLIAAAKARFQNDPRLVFPQRVITRPSMTSAEAHSTVTEHEFVALMQAGRFALSWQAHGLYYGIPADDVKRVHNGQTVVANVSRGVVAQAEQLAPIVTVMHVTAPLAILAARVATRGRETLEDIEQRIARDAPINATRASVLVIQNDRDLATAADQFCTELESTHLNAISRRE